MPHRCRVRSCLAWASAAWSTMRVRSAPARTCAWRTAIYAADVANDGGVPAAAKESIEDTTDAANRLHGAARIDLLHDAATSFDVAARWGLAVCMATLLLSAAGAAIGLTGQTPAKR